MYQGRDTTGRREGLVTVFTKLGVRCSGTRRNIFQGGHMVWLGLLVSHYFPYCFLILDLFVSISLSFFFSFFLSQEQGIMPECEICGDQGC